MGFDRKQVTQTKRRNPVAQYDQNRGGVHGKSVKAQRTNFKQSLNQYDLDDLLEDEFADYEQDDYI